MQQDLDNSEYLKLQVIPGLQKCQAMTGFNEWESKYPFLLFNGKTITGNPTVNMLESQLTNAETGLAM